VSASTYRAIVCEALGPPERLTLRSLARVPLAPGQVRVAIKAAGINFPDVLMVQGRYQHRPELPFVPGIEAAGIVAEVAAGTRDIAVGQRVIVRLRTGGYAEEAVVPVTAIHPLPAAFCFAEGATFLAAHVTAYHALRTKANLTPGQSLLVLGAGGGVGLAGVQLGKVLGARVLAAASRGDKLAVACEHGADHPINYAQEDVADAVKRITAGAGVDVLLDPVGILGLAALRCLAWNGKLLIVGFAGGVIPSYAANRLLLRGGTLIGVRAGEAGRRDPALRREELRALLTLADAGKVRPLVSARFPLEAWVEATGMLIGRRALGRIALTMRDT
jgi:NADPH2:quinone reductase